MATYSKETLGKVLKLFRVNGVQLELKEVAKKSGLNTTYISDLEDGKKNPSLENLKKFSEVYNIPVNEIIRIQEETDENNWTDEQIINEFHEVKKRIEAEKNPKVTIGQILRTFRVVHDEMTATKLADILGFSQPYIARIENDSKKASDNLLSKLSEVYNVPKEEFFKLQNICNEKNLDGIYIFNEVLKCLIKYDKAAKEGSQV